MVSLEAASLILSLARGAIKLAGRMDRLMAEKDAVTADLIIPVPALTIGPGGVQMVMELKTHLETTADLSPDPLGAERDRISAVLDQDLPDPEQVEKWYKQFFPLKAIAATVEPDAEFYRTLQQELPSVNWADDDNRYAAFYIAAGRDDAELSYTWRAALVVVDVLAEFGAENAALFFDDRRAKPVIEAVLQRFSRPDLGNFTAWNPLLRHTLGATLNGLLDSRQAWQGQNVWMNAVLNALTAACADAGDDYLLGLIQGNGYRLLISQGLSEAAGILGGADASGFEKVTAHILTNAAPLVKANDGNFREFFQDHWGDLLRAGLRSLEKFGPAMLADNSPLLRETLTAMIHELAQASNKEFVGHETLYHLADTAISTVAANPSMISANMDTAWLKELVTSVTLIVGDQGFRKSISKQGLEAIVNSSLQVFADHPEMIIKESGLLQNLVGGVLGKIGSLSGFNAELIASATVEGALEAVADNPSLLDTPYAQLTADFAGHLADLISSQTITGIQAADIAATVAETITLNPILFLETENRVNALVLDAVLRVAGNSHKKLLVGATLVAVVEELLCVTARYGQLLIGDGPVEALGPKLIKTLAAGVARAEVEIGRGLDLVLMPMVLAELVIRLAKGEPITIDPEDETFKQFFAELVIMVSA